MDSCHKAPAIWLAGQTLSILLKVFLNAHQHAEPAVLTAGSFEAYCRARAAVTAPQSQLAPVTPSNVPLAQRRKRQHDAPTPTDCADPRLHCLQTLRTRHNYTSRSQLACKTLSIVPLGNTSASSPGRQESQSQLARETLSIVPSLSCQAALGTGHAPSRLDITPCATQSVCTNSARNRSDCNARHCNNAGKNNGAPPPNNCHAEEDATIPLSQLAPETLSNVRVAQCSTRQNHPQTVHTEHANHLNRQDLAFSPLFPSRSQLAHETLSNVHPGPDDKSAQGRQEAQSQLARETLSNVLSLPCQACQAPPVSGRVPFELDSATRAPSSTYRQGGHIGTNCGTTYPNHCSAKATAAAPQSQLEPVTLSNAPPACHSTRPFGATFAYRYGRQEAQSQLAHETQSIVLSLPRQATTGLSFVSTGLDIKPSDTAPQSQLAPVTLSNVPLVCHSTRPPGTAPAYNHGRQEAQSQLAHETQSIVPSLPRQATTGLSFVSTGLDIKPSDAAPQSQLAPVTLSNVPPVCHNTRPPGTAPAYNHGQQEAQLQHARETLSIVLSLPCQAAPGSGNTSSRLDTTPCETLPTCTHSARNNTGYSAQRCNSAGKNSGTPPPNSCRAEEEDATMPLSQLTPETLSNARVAQRNTRQYHPQTVRSEHADHFILYRQDPSFSPNFPSWSQLARETLSNVHLGIDAKTFQGRQEAQSQLAHETLSNVLSLPCQAPLNSGRIPPEPDSATCVPPSTHQQGGHIGSGTAYINPSSARAAAIASMSQPTPATLSHVPPAHRSMRPPGTTLACRYGRREAQSQLARETQSFILSLPRQATIGLGYALSELDTRPSDTAPQSQLAPVTLSTVPLARHSTRPPGTTLAYNHGRQEARSQLARETLSLVLSPPCQAAPGSGNTSSRLDIALCATEPAYTYSARNNSGYSAQHCNGCNSAGKNSGTPPPNNCRAEEDATMPLSQLARETLSNVRVAQRSTRQHHPQTVRSEHADHFILYQQDPAFSPYFPSRSQLAHETLSNVHLGLDAKSFQGRQEAQSQLAHETLSNVLFLPCQAAPDSGRISSAPDSTTCVPPSTHQQDGHLARGTAYVNQCSARAAAIASLPQLTPATLSNVLPARRSTRPLGTTSACRIGRQEAQSQLAHETQSTVLSLPRQATTGLGYASSGLDTKPSAAAPQSQLNHGRQEAQSQLARETLSIVLSLPCQATTGSGYAVPRPRLDTSPSALLPLTHCAEAHSGAASTHRRNARDEDPSPRQLAPALCRSAQHCNAPVTFTAPADLLLHYLQTQTSGLLHSWLAYITAALFSLLLWGLQLQGGERNADPLIRVGRCISGPHAYLWAALRCTQPHCSPPEQRPHSRNGQPANSPARSPPSSSNIPFWAKLLAVACLFTPAQSMQPSGAFSVPDPSHTYAATSVSQTRPIPTPSRSHSRPAAICWTETEHTSPQDRLHVSATRTSNSGNASANPRPPRGSNQHADSNSPKQSTRKEDTLLNSLPPEQKLRAFFLAATLLDTLFEHNQQQAPPKTGADKSKATTAARQPCGPSQDPYASLAGLESALAGCKEAWTDFWRRQPPCDLPCGSRSQLQGPLPFFPACLRALDIYTDGSHKDSHCPGWAIILVDGVQFGEEKQYAACAYGTVKAIADIGLCRDNHLSNIDAEGIPVLLALLWTLGLDIRIHVTIWTDCEVIATAANGASSPPDAKEKQRRLCPSIRQVMQIHEARTSPVQVQWTKGHVGQIYNESADALANHARSTGACTALPKAVLALLEHELLPWAWRLQAQTSAIPSLQELLKGEYEEREAAAPAHLPVPRSSTTARTQPLQLRVATYNVQSMRDRGPLLQALMRRDGVAVLGLQETRYRTASLGQGETHITVSSAATPRGEGGCAIWIAKDAQIGPVQIKDATVLISTDRHLLIRLCTDKWTGYILSAHAPHTGKPAEEIAAWWDDLTNKLNPYVGTGLPLICCIDANARVGATTSQAVGPHASEAENFAGACLRNFCHVNALCAPTTFQGIKGQCVEPDTDVHTWASSHGDTHRIDYVLVPQDWLSHCSEIRMHPDFSLREGEDHTATSLKITLQAGAISKPSRAHARIPLLRVSDTQQAEAPIPAALQTASQVPWSTNIHDHVARVDDMLRSSCRSQGPKQHRKAHISQHTWNLVRYRREARHRIKAAHNGIQRLRQLICWRAWKLGHISAEFIRKVQEWRDRQCALHRRHATAIRDTSVASLMLRASLKQDRLDHLEVLAAKFQEAANKGASQQLYHALKIYRPAGKKVHKSFGQPLTVMLPTGKHAETFAEKQQAHRDVFAQQEAGTILTPAEYCSQDAPSRVEPRAAKTLLPIFMKAHIRLTEPIQYRGCQLVAFFKQKGTPTDPLNYRSIALFDPAAKMHHRLLRPALCQQLGHTAQPLQQGCVRGSSSNSLHHYVATWGRISKARGAPCATIFLDLSAAYYRLLRESMWPTAADGAESPTDQHVAWILGRLQVPATLMHQVQQYARNTDLLEQAPEHLRRYVRVMLSGTYFVQDGLEGLVRTHAGSRPGDAIADALFALAAADMLREVQEHLNLNGQPCPLPTWADDVALPLTCDSCEEVVNTVQQAATVLHDSCTRRAMAPNYAAGKTEVLVCPTGPGSKKLKRSLFRTGEGTIEFTGGDGRHLLRCVTSYKHLGNVISETGAALPDIRQNLAAAQASAGPLTKKVFRNDKAPFATRSLLMQSLAVSRAVHGAEVWGKLSRRESHVWHHGLARVLRKLLPEDRYTGDSTWAASADVFGATGHPNAEQCLSAARLRHLVQISRGQHEDLWHLLQVEAACTADAWLHLVQRDLAWLQGLFDRETTPRLPAEVFEAGADNAHSLRQLHHQIRRGMRKVGEHNWHEYQRSLQSKKAVPGPSPAPSEASRVELEHPFACEKCPAAFSTRQQVRAHRLAKHGQRPLLESYVGASLCTVCLTQFWARRRLIRHVTHDSKTCGWQLLTRARAQPLVDLRQRERARAIKATASGGIHAQDRLPAVRVHGPLRREVPPDMQISPDLLSMQAVLDIAHDSTHAWPFRLRVTLDEYLTASPATQAVFFQSLSEAQQHVLERLVQATEQIHTGQG
ncbi:CFDP2 [Symbiodinium natans]|uniref:CFDP2 protein n=1 Tax=Symbiodinium natans TaxID=878477 RepID=A0A812LAD9_9DINO|nr:CFDP2 [Symbiodinium natans]